MPRNTVQESQRLIDSTKYQGIRDWGFKERKREKGKKERRIKENAVHTRFYSTRHFCMVHLAMRYPTTITFMDHLHGSTWSSV